MLLAVVALTIAAPAALVVLALVMPFCLALRMETDPWKLDLRVAPFAGRFGWFAVPRRAGARKARKTSGPTVGLPLLRALPRFLTDLVDRIRIDQLGLDLRFGTGDPALTGQIFGWLMSLAYGGGNPVALRIVPDFDQTCLAGHADLVLRVSPVRLAGPLFQFWRSARARA